MEQICLAGKQKSGLRSRTLYRVAAVGIATLITQASPGGAASSWGVECLATDLASNSYCVTSLNDDIPTGDANWTLRKSVESANAAAEPSATIGFQDALFSAATSSDNAKLVLNSTLEIKTNITITAPTDSGGSPLLTIVRGDSVASGAPLIAINPTADAHPATPTTGPAANQATEEVRIENVNIQARANTENPQGSGFAGQTRVTANPGVTIQVKETISVTSTGPEVVAPTVVLVNTTISNAVSESGGAAINTPGNVRVEGSTLVGNVAITPSGGAPTDGGAIKAEGTVTVVSSALNNNGATGNGGAISATTVIVENAPNLQNSQLIGNTAGGSGGAISAEGTVSVSESTLTGNTATLGSGGAVSAGDQVTVSASTISSNIAKESGGAISAGDQVTLSASTLNGNNATLGSGGAVSAAGQVTVSASTVSSNIAKQSGGAISAGDQVTVSASTLNNNTAEGNGGAISTRGEVTVSASILNSNTATLGSGGAISTVVSVAVIETSTVSSNTAKEDGGAIKAGGDVLVAQSTLSDNTATTGSGGAISTVADVAVINSSTLSSNISNDNGGAISAGGQVEVSTSTLNGNTATEGDGGAIAAGSHVTISASNLNGNEALEGYGGAIYAGAAINLSDTEFFSNTAFESGGAIYAEGNVAVIDSVFGINVESDVEAQEEPETRSNVAYLSQGGAIYSEGKVTTTRSAFVQNFSGSGGGAIAAEQTVSVNGSIFVGNGSFGDGGAVYATGGVIVENGSVLLANTAGVNPESEFGFGFLYPIFLDGPVYFDMEISGGNGGAIYSEGDVRVSGSNIGAAPPGVGAEFSSVFANKALCAAFWDDGDESGWGQECDWDEVYYEDDFDYFEEVSVGNGGGIYALGKVTIEGGNTTINIDLDALSLLDTFIAKEVSFEQSYLTNNYAQNNGGAVYALGGLSVSDAIFGATPEINPNYNPERRYLNPTYVPERTEPNPLFGNGELPRVPNILFDPEVPSIIPNSMCAGANQFYGNENTGESWCVIDGIWYTTTIQNPDPASIPDFPNDLYSNEPFLYYEDIGDEFLYLLDDESKAENNHKFIYRGNVSGSDGGAIYVEGITTINNSTFQGNTSDNDGGAIYSEGTLELKDSGFNRNWAEDDGGAIRTTPGSGDLFITRASFTENVAMDDGGAIDISTVTDEHYDDVILSSLFRGNEAFGTGGAVDSGYVVLILNTFEDNKSLEGQSLNVSGGYLSGNVLIGPAGGQDLCFAAGDLIANYNYGTDESCFVSNNYLLTRGEITTEGALHTLPEGYETTLLGELKDNEEFFLEVPSENNLDGMLAPLGTFITNELNKDFKSEIRDSTVSWTAGHLQGIFPDLTSEPEGDNSEGDTEIVQPKDKEEKSQEQNSGSNNQVVVNQPDSTNLDSPVLIFEPTLSAEELARISQLRAEQLAAELLRQKEAERIAAENIAKNKAAKLARDKARALAAEKRRAQLAALKAKIAATHARGVALKQKPSWINLMKNSAIPNAAKGLVRVPTK